MDISKLNNSKFIDGTSRNKRTETGSAVQETSKEKKTSAGTNQKNTDQFSISESSKISEQELALRAYNKLKQDSFARLNDIKTKITNGAYNSSEIHSNVSHSVDHQLSSLDRSLTDEAVHEPTLKKLSDEKKEFLTQDPKVQQVVSEEVSKSISKL